jgi:hypothetical protein
LRVTVQPGARQGLDRRRFLETRCAIATAFLAMNQVFGRPQCRATVQRAVHRGRPRSTWTKAAVTADKIKTSAPKYQAEGGNRTHFAYVYVAKTAA